MRSLCDVVVALLGGLASVRFAGRWFGSLAPRAIVDGPMDALPLLRVCVVTAVFLVFGMEASGTSSQVTAEEAGSDSARSADSSAVATSDGSLVSWQIRFEERMNAALEAAEAALASEEERLDRLAAQNSKKTLLDGRTSMGQATANIRLWNQRIGKLSAEEQELRRDMNDTLSSLVPAVQALAERLSKQQERDRRREQEVPDHDDGEREHAIQQAAVGGVFQDCPECPRMVEVPAGQFDMGSSSSDEDGSESERPVRQVTIGYPFAVGVHEVTRGEFRVFVRDRNRSMGNSCWTWSGEWEDRRGIGWQDPGFPQDDDHPVTCVSWNDAKAFARWLSDRTGERYRLLSESEWEYVARAGTTAARYWGDDNMSAQCSHANGAKMQRSSQDSEPFGGCDDGHRWTSPVGSLDANPFGLHDVLGNVFEWVDDCWNQTYEGAPSNGTSWEAGNCGRRVFRGGAWLYGPSVLRSAFRVAYKPGYRSVVLGFRVARSLPR